MASLNEIAYNIKNLAYNGDSNEEENIGIRQIKFWIHYYRAKILKEIEKEGKGMPLECLQYYHFDSDDYRVYQTNLDFKLWADAQSGSSDARLIPYSKRTLTLANAGGTTLPTANYYGDDYYPIDRGGQADELGTILLTLPEILNISGYGVKNLRVRRQNIPDTHNVWNIDVPIVNKSIATKHYYSRFGKKSITSWIENIPNDESGLKQSLYINNLQSVLRNSNSQDDTGNPIFYRVSANLLLSNPTDLKSWNDDNDAYPFPDYLISDLTKSVMQEMQIALTTQPDMVTDGMDTTRVQVQQKAQK